MRDGRIIDWNPHAEAMFGWSQDEVQGRSLTETIIPPDQREDIAIEFRRFLETGKSPLLNK
jgi:phosphoserine phosphatase RsbU/P